MTYRPLGLGTLILTALRTAVADPALKAQADAATAGIAELNGRLTSLANELEENETLDGGQAETLAGIQADLQELAASLAPAILEVEAPAEAPAPVEGTGEPETPDEAPSEPVAPSGDGDSD